MTDLPLVLALMQRAAMARNRKEAQAVLEDARSLKVLDQLLALTEAR